MSGSGPEARWTWVDLRLVPMAAAVWTVALGAPRLSPALLGGAAVVAAVAAGLLARAPTALAAMAVAGLAGVVLGAGSAAARGAVREASPLTEAAEQARTVDAEFEVTSTPRVVPGGRAPRVVATVTVRGLMDGVRGGLGGLRDEAVLFAPAERWRELLPGQAVRARVTTSVEPGSGPATPVVLSARGPPQVIGRPGLLQRAAGGLRAWLARAAGDAVGGAAGALLPGLVVGDTSAMDPVLVADFRRAGLSHLTAVSGANVAIVVAGVLWPLRRRAVDRRAQALVAALALGGFVVLAGPEPSVLRATAMGGVSLVALASGRARAAMPALGAAVILLLVVRPSLAGEPGFALSVAATAAIVLLAPAWSRRLRNRGCPAVVADALSVSTAAGLATAPLIAALNGTISLVSLPANLLAAPAVAPATVLGLAATLVGPLFGPGGTALVWLAGWPARWIVLVAERAAALPDAATGWPAGIGGAVVLTLLLSAVGWALWRWPRLRPLAVAAAVGLVVVGWPLRHAVRGWPPTDTVVVACDVGEGDALVMPTGAGEGVLVDAGPDVGAVDRCLDRLGISALPLVLLSHLDADHADGLAGALAGRRVGVVATATLSPADDRGVVLDALVQRAGGQRATLVPGDRRTVGDAVVEVLAPDPRRATWATAANDLAMVVRITQHGVRVLFTGDLGAEAEARLVRERVDLSADVLKVPHHGSADADPGFLAASGARVGLVSVGANNTYGHPAARTLRLLARAGMQVHRTDREGDLAVAGTAGAWGVAGRGQSAAAAGSTGDPELWTESPGLPSPAENRRRPVTPCIRACPARRTDVAAARRRGGGGAPARPGGRGRAGRRARPPPGHRGARARRARSAPG